jgi:PKD repeat protein
MSCFVTPGSSGVGHITIDVETNVVTGVAPLLVYFDAKGTTSDATSRPFIECAFCWHFGDPSSGNFATNGYSKNVARGPEAAHLFETPGVYTVTLAVRDPLGRVLVHSPITITVSDPEVEFAGTDTICFSTSGNFADAPAGSTHVTTSVVSGIESHVATGKRLLLRRGETFSVDSGFNINVAGPGTVGAFGTPSDPKPKLTTTIPAFLISGDPALVDDWRIMDIEVDGLSNANSRIANIQGTGINILFLRVDGTPGTVGRGFSAPLSIINLQNQDLSDGVFFWECDVRSIMGGSGCNIIAIATRRLAVLGCEFHDTTLAEHIIRIFHCDRGVISCNNMGEVSAVRLLIKCHAADYDDATSSVFEEYTQYIVTSDNTFDAVDTTDFLVGYGPQNDNFDERLQWIIHERNFMQDAVGSQLFVAFGSARDCVARYNIMRGSDFGQVFLVGRNPPDPLVQEPSVRIELSNNSVYRTAGSSTFMSFDDSWDDITAHNNLLTRCAMNADNAGFTSSNTVTTTTPGYAVEPPLDPEDFHLLATSPARGAGDSAYASAWDYFFARLAFGSTAPATDAGAAVFANAVSSLFFGATP